MRTNTILVADKPILLGGVPKEVAIDEFVKQYNKETGQQFTWLADYAGKKHADWTHLGLVLCNINEKVGYGVFASKPIPKGKKVAVYAGQKINKKLTEMKEELGLKDSGY